MRAASGILIDVNDEQLWKAKTPHTVREAGMVMEVMDEQPAKQHRGIVFNESGRRIDVNDEQRKNASPPIEVTEFGRSIEVTFNNLANAQCPTDVIVFGMMTVCRLGNCPLHLLNAESPIEVKVSGIAHEVPSSDRRRRASAWVKTVMLEGEGREWNVVLVIVHEIRNRSMN